MLDRSAFYPQGVQCASPQKAWQKRLCHMVASRCESHFSVLANVYRWLNMEIEQLANLKRTLRILANEWLVQWFQGFENVYCSARQIVPRRNLIVPHEMSVKIRRERRLLIANFRCFIKTSQAKSVYLWALTHKLIDKPQLKKTLQYKNTAALLVTICYYLASRPWV